MAVCLWNPLKSTHKFEGLHYGVLLGYRCFISTGICEIDVSLSPLKHEKTCHKATLIHILNDIIGANVGRE